MKRINSILLACVMVLGLASCVETAPEYIPGEPDNVSCAVFPDISAQSNLSLNGTPIEVPFTRTNTNGTLDVQVSLADDSGIFSLKSNTVSFASGESVANAYVTYDYDKLDPKDSYKIEVTMDTEANASQYHAVTIPFTCVKAWKDLGIGEFFDNLALMSSDSYGIAKCTILQSPDGALRYRIMNPYADQAQRAAAWDEDCAKATPSEYIEFWVTDEEKMTVTWNSYWLTGLWYQGTPGNDIKAYLPSVKSQSDANCRFIEENIVQFTPYYYIDGLGGFGMYSCYLSMPGGPDLEAWLDGE